MKLLIPPFIFVLACLSAASADSNTLPKLPVVSKHKTDFVPKDWKAEQILSGHLLSKKSQDWVLQLKESELTQDSNGRRMLLVLTQVGPAYKRSDLAGHILLCNKCGNALGHVDVSIVGNTICIDELRGANDGEEVKFKFKWQPSRNCFCLVQQIVEHFNRASGSSEVTEVKYNSGTESIKTVKRDENGATKVSSRVHKSRAATMSMRSIDIESIP